MDLRADQWAPHTYCTLRIQGWGEFIEVRVEVDSMVMGIAYGRTLGQALIAVGSLIAGYPVVPAGVDIVKWVEEWTPPLPSLDDA